MTQPAKKIRRFSDLSDRLLKAIEALAGMKMRALGEIAYFGEAYPFWCAESDGGFGKKQICLSGGIHGDEPAGVEAVQQWLAALAKKQDLLDRFQFTVFPCINPFGYEYNTRENGAQVDLNREFDKKSPQSEVRFLKEAIAGRRFDFAYECHEDLDSQGYYLYEMARNGRKPIGAAIIERIEKICPINKADAIEEMPARGGVISTPTQMDADFLARLEQRGGWPQTLYLSAQGSDLCITAETPTRLAMQQRVDAHLLAFETALNLI